MSDTKQQGAGMPMQTKWKMVPVEPTEKIRLAIKDAICKNAEQHELSDLQECGLIYKDAISAAPPCEDLETVRKKLESVSICIDLETVHAAIDEALAALGRIRGEG